MDYGWMVAEPSHVAAACRPRAAPTRTAADIELLVEKLERMKNKRTLELAFEIGKAVTDHLYNGDPTAHRRRGAHDSAYRQLVEHPRLSLSPSTVWRALGVYELCSRMPELLGCPDLKVRHLYAVLSLLPAHQEQLLSAAAREKWPVEKLEARAASRRCPGGRGRPRHTPFRRAVTLLSKFVEVEVYDAGLGTHDDKVQRDALEVIRQARRKCDELERRLNADRAPNADRVEPTVSRLCSDCDEPRVSRARREASSSPA